ncbi:hypothetical protein FHX42_003934 [Saccharopolyspora lacisalsi]|uniref:DUF4231 domain-containing protein n=1 Tax=Halosaccharopolyspora lacisalsi TaxID=1000566 RepID=A0A839E426_9PSEU|nr:DUF4231 domain-containing protein [Halosaccharopolyspora lacisalsi]MBA8826555.1 hypothetical protein [Halosaccharopolyspora lacisalsi]
MSSTQVTTGILGGGVISGDSHPDDLRRRVGERSEQLHRSRLVQRLLAAWTFPGNLVLLVLGVGCFTWLRTPPVWLLVLAVLLPLASSAASSRVLYNQHFRVRSLGMELRELRRAQREHQLDDLGGDDLLAAHKRYRAELPDTIERYRCESRGHRHKHNVLQGMTIAGAIVTSVVVAVSVSVVEARWLAVGASLVVAISAAFGGYAKYRERSLNLQQTADALEREYHSVELRVGRYRRFEDERAAYAEFAHEVESLREEHTRRLQQTGHVAGPEFAV